MFVEKLKMFNSHFAGARDILELGGDQGWASCIVKRSYPGARLTLTDISEDARACRSYETPFPDASFDLIFAFSAAHHFVRHRRTLQEIRRLCGPAALLCICMSLVASPFFMGSPNIESTESVPSSRGCTAISGNRGFCAKGWARSQSSAITQPNE